MREPVELIDDDLDLVAGGTGGDNISVDLDQTIKQVQINYYGDYVDQDQSATQTAAVVINS